MDTAAWEVRALAAFDATDPIASLARQGVTPTRNVHTHRSSTSVSIGGLSISPDSLASETYTITQTWDVTGPIQATFGKEGVGKKLVKIFKKELQTGDKSFDDTVYISTKTAELTRALLEVRGVRELIAGFVRAGGEVAIDGTHVKLTLAPSKDEDVNPDPYTAALLVSLVRTAVA